MVKPHRAEFWEFLQVSYVHSANPPEFAGKVKTRTGVYRNSDWCSFTKESNARQTLMGAQHRTCTKSFIACHWWLIEHPVLTQKLHFHQTDRQIQRKVLMGFSWVDIGPCSVRQKRGEVLSMIVGWGHSGNRGELLARYWFLRISGWIVQTSSQHHEIRFWSSGNGVVNWYFSPWKSMQCK